MVRVLVKAKKDQRKGTNTRIRCHIPSALDIADGRGSGARRNGPVAGASVGGEGVSSDRYGAVFSAILTLPVAPHTYYDPNDREHEQNSNEAHDQAPDDVGRL